MNEIKSIFDGWEKQCFEALHIGDASCAMGHIDALRYRDNVYIGDADDLADKTIRRVAHHARAHFDLPPTYRHPSSGCLHDLTQCDISVIIYANNVLKLTPEQFREIDRQSQIEAIARPLIDSVPVAEPLGEADGISYVGLVK